MRRSIFQAVAPTGPTQERPRVVDLSQVSTKKHVEPAPKFAASASGFGAPKQTAAVRVVIPGENYDDYMTTEDKEEGAKEPVNFSAPNAEVYSEETALNLKKATSYYGEEEDTTSSTVANPPPSLNSSFTQPGAYVDISPATGSYVNEDPPSSVHTAGTVTSGLQSGASTTTGGYEDESSGDVASSNYSTGGYADDAPTEVSSTTNTGAYEDDSETVPSTGGYEDDSAGKDDTKVGGYEDNSSDGYKASTTGYSATSAANTESTGGYTDDASEATATTGGYEDGDDTKVETATTVAYSDDTQTGGYSDESTTGGYSDQATGGSYSDDAQTGGYTEETQRGVGGAQRAFATISSPNAYAGPASTTSGGYSDDADTGGYSDDTTGGYTEAEGGAYSDATPVGGANPAPDHFKARAEQPSAIDYVGNDSGNAYVDGGASEAGYAEAIDYEEETSDPSASNTNASPSGAPKQANTVQPKLQPPSDGSRDWNEEFQQRIADFRKIVKQQSTLPAATVLQSAHDLYQLSLEFIATAQEIGRVIIEEVSIPAPAKTIKPVNVGGVAGGEKYVQRGVFFKFAIDAFGVYGGDEFAQKAAGHELAGLKAYYNCAIEGLNTPFMLLMDYRGYRLIATTKLPIGGTSLIYGSADGGITVRSENATMNQMMKQAATILNIKAHTVGMRNQTSVLHAPTDIEGHLGLDGRYYVLDTARICPPEPVHKSFTAVIVPPEDPYPSNIKKFKLWNHRTADMSSKENTGEFWNPWPALKEVGLTTDRWQEQIYNHLGIVNNGSVVAASEEFGEGLLYHLKEDQMMMALRIKEGLNRAVNVRASNLVGKVIHGTALLVLRGRKGAQLFNLLRYETVRRNNVPLSSDAFTPFGKHNRDVHNEEVENCFYEILSKTIPDFLNTGRLFPHAAGALKAIQDAGINTRMIGFLRSNILDSQPNATALRTWLLNEMIVRVTKNYLRSKLRRATSKLKPIEPIIIKRFNLLLGVSPVSTFFWSTELKAQIVNKFGRNGQALTPLELRTENDLRSSLNKLALFQMLQSKIGVVFTEHANGRFQVDPSRFNVEFPLSEKDLSKLSVLQKSLMQPELDNLILKTALSASSNDPEKMLELSGRYLPESSTHPAIALQRLHIAEKLAIDISSRLGHKFGSNFIYSSNVEPVVSTSESTPDYLRTSKVVPLDRQTDGMPRHQNEALIEELQNMKEYTELLSHLEVLRLWVDSTPYCPLEITCKLFYLRGCVAFIHRMWTTSEAFLKASYDCITRATHVPGAQQGTTYAKGYVTVDNDRPISLLILDRLIHVLLVQDRFVEALGYAEKFIAQLADSAFPGTYEDLKPLFGPLAPVAFSIYRSFPSEREQIRNVLDPLEKTLLSNKKTNQEALEAWKRSVFMINYSELSGYFMSPSVFQLYLDQGDYLENFVFPPSAERKAPFMPTIRSRTRTSRTDIDVSIHIPPVLVASHTPRNIRATMIGHPNRFTYADYPIRLVLVSECDYTVLSKDPERRFFVSVDKIVAEKLIDREKPRGTYVFENVLLPHPGSYICLLIDGKYGLISSVSTSACQVMKVVLPEVTTQKMIFSHDFCSNYWSLLTELPSSDIDNISIADSDYDKFDGKASDTKVLLLDTSGKVWSTEHHNWQQQPQGLLKNGNSQAMVPIKWALYSELMAWKVKQVAISVTHTLVLTDNNEVLSLGENKYGALGHGDTVSQSDPRLVRRLKGKDITKIYAAEHCSAAVDGFGAVYQFGEGFGALPEIHPFFSGKSEASKGQVIPISKVVFQAFREESSSTESRKRSDHREYPFFSSSPIAYISTEGSVYVWCFFERIFPKAEEYKPELIQIPDQPIVDVAIGSKAIAFVTLNGEVWTAGTNTDGELGVGFGFITHTMEPRAYRSAVPYGCAQKVKALEGHNIIKVNAALEKFFVISDMGEYFEWGGCTSWLPRTPAALQGLKVVEMSTGLRGATFTVNQNASLPLPGSDLAIELEIQRSMTKSSILSSSVSTTSGGGGVPSEGATKQGGAEMAPNVKTSGMAFKVTYEELDEAPDFNLHVEIPKTQLGSYEMRVVRPGEVSMGNFLVGTIYLSLNDNYSATIHARFSDCKWGKAPITDTALVMTPPVKAPGPFEVLLVSRGEGSSSSDDSAITIHYRSPTFQCRARSIEYKLKMTPARPKPSQEVTFEISPGIVAMGHHLSIRNTADGSLAGVVSINSRVEKWTAFMAGTFRVSWEVNMAPHEPPLDVFDFIDFEVGTPPEELPHVDIEPVPLGPYHAGQSIVLDWKFTRNAPSGAGSIWGGVYSAADTTVSATLVGGFISFSAVSGTTTIIAPKDKGEYAFRCWGTTSSGVEKIASVPLSVVTDTADELEALSAPVYAELDGDDPSNNDENSETLLKASDSHSDDDNDDIEVSLETLMKDPMAQVRAIMAKAADGDDSVGDEYLQSLRSTVDRLTSSFSNPQSPSSPSRRTPSSKPSSSSPKPSSSDASVPKKYETWISFFSDCNITKGSALGYDRVFTKNEVPIAKLEFLDGGVLYSLGITDVKHQLAILEKVQQLKQAQMKQWFLQQMSSYAASVPPSLD